MELNRKHALIGLAVIAILLITMTTVAFELTSSVGWKFGDEDCTSVLTVQLLDENDVPINVPLIANSPFYSGEQLVTKIQISITTTVTVDTSYVDWETVSIVPKTYIISYVDDTAQSKVWLHSTFLTHGAFTYDAATDTYSNVDKRNYLLTDVPMQQNSVAEDGTITWKFDIKVEAGGYILDLESIPINAGPYEDTVGPVVLTTPAGIPGDIFSFNVALNPWSFP